jgi:hypothetical protein
MIQYTDGSGIWLACLHAFVKVYADHAITRQNEANS